LKGCSNLSEIIEEERGVEKKFMKLI